MNCSINFPTVYSTDLDEAALMLLPDDIECRVKVERSGAKLTPTYPIERCTGTPIRPGSSITDCDMLKFSRIRFK